MLKSKTTKKVRLGIVTSILVKVLAVLHVGSVQSLRKPTSASEHLYWATEKQTLKEKCYLNSA